jgi:hypothetical protein
MQVREPGRPISNLEAASLLTATRNRRSARFPPSKENSIREVQTLFYLTHDAGSAPRQVTAAALERQSTIVAQLTEAGIDGETALQMVNMPASLDGEATLFVVLPGAEERLGESGVQRVVAILNSTRR